MDKLKLILICILVIWFYKFSSNLYMWLRIKSLCKRYKEFETDKTTDNVEIEEYLPEIRELFGKAHIAADIQVPFNKIDLIRGIEASGKIKPLMNISSDLPEIIAFYNKKFIEARGYFKKGFIDSFNPFYWIEFYIYFPQKLLNYLNIINDIAIKIVNIIYWLGLAAMIGFEVLK